MTACIAAVCDDGDRIVVASDRLMSIPLLNLQVESESCKIQWYGGLAVVLVSGNTPQSSKMLDHLTKEHSPPYNDVCLLADRLANSFAAVRQDEAFQYHVRGPLGWEFDKAAAVGVSLPTYLRDQSQAFQQLAANVQQYGSDVQFIVAGIDEGQRNLFVVQSLGTAHNYSSLGYASIGSGYQHAMISLSLSRQTRTRTLAETMAAVHLAKRAAESAIGVGSTTDFAVIDKAKGVVFASKELIELLEAESDRVAEASRCTATQELMDAYDLIDGRR